MNDTCLCVAISMLRVTELKILVKCSFEGCLDVPSINFYSSACSSQPGLLCIIEAFSTSLIASWVTSCGGQLVLIN